MISLCVLCGSMATFYACSSTEDYQYETKDTMTIHSHQVAGKEMYELLLLTDIANIEAGNKATLSFLPIRDKVHKVSLQTNHEKKIHLIVVSDDLSYFEHIHPEPREEFYTVETTFPSGGEYSLFAEYVPEGDEQQIQRFDFNVKGPGKDYSSYTEQQKTTLSGDYSVTLDIPAEGLNTGSLQIPVTISKGSTEIPATDLEDYLGSKAHAILVSVRNKNFVHAHPEVRNKKLIIPAYVQEPGFYRLWLQFKLKGLVHTADFVIKVHQSLQPEQAGIIHRH